jgi:ATP-dependent Clp protease adaptor protein ClpS
MEGGKIMADSEKEARPDAPADETPAKSKDSSTQTKPAPTKPRPKHLPIWKVLLHNDDVNQFDHVIKTIVMLTRLNEQEATLRTAEAHVQGVSLLLSTHQERAELYQQQFGSRNLTVTIEPSE